MTLFCFLADVFVLRTWVVSSFLWKRGWPDVCFKSGAMIKSALMDIVPSTSEMSESIYATPMQSKNELPHQLTLLQRNSPARNPM
eukprot:3599952-Amphidinium_carterae.1